MIKQKKKKVVARANLPKLNILTSISSIQLELKGENENQSALAIMMFARVALFTGEITYWKVYLCPCLILYPFLELGRSV
ncbi:hypothetical protein EUGRSUZ_K00127 [Eucalyptus grandis]|uniref:Uncharacterized protein n=2 Tax=Eucalyptus grandis TaxID=71139 RepID=A0ACC3IPF5_EUCGR|nr:hypothetical protein EUGRSUZ_K00127 [Eucalyptus grandis]